MFIVIAYDVVCDKRRARLARLLSGFGERVNYSVFECSLRKADLQKLRGGVEKLINKKEDHVRYYELCVECRKRITVNGKPARFEHGGTMFV